jgi:hypothetical protein
MLPDHGNQPWANGIRRNLAMLSKVLNAIPVICFFLISLAFVILSIEVGYCWAKRKPARKPTETVVPFYPALRTKNRGDMQENGKVHLNRRQIAKVIYSLILILVMTLVVEESPPAGFKNTLLVLLTAFAVMLAELYSDVISSLIQAKRRLTTEELKEIFGDVGAVILAALLPALFFFLNGVGILSHESALRLAKWSIILLLGIYGYLAGRLTSRSLSVSIPAAGSSILIGLVIVSLKFIIESI